MLAAPSTGKDVCSQPRRGLGIEEQWTDAGCLSDTCHSLQKQASAGQEQVVRPDELQSGTPRPAVYVWSVS